MTRVRIENATHLVTVNAATRSSPTRPSSIDDGVITDDHDRRPTGRGAARGVDQVIDARGKLLMPGLVNLHTHLPMTLLRGLAENLDLQGFLEHLWAAEAAVMDPESVELGATLGRPREPARRLHDPARHVLPPRGGPSRRRGRGQPARHRPGVLRRPRARRPGLARAPRPPAGLARPARRDRRPAGPGGGDAARHLHVLPGGPHRGRGHAAQGARRHRPTGPAHHARLREPRRERRHPRALRRHPHRAALAHRLARARPAVRARPRRAPHRGRPRPGRRRPAPPSATAPGRTASSPAVPCTGKRCATAASGSVWAPMAARAPTTSTCGRRCARPPCSPGSRAADPTSRAPPRCCAPRPSRAPGPWAWATRSARSRSASVPTWCSSTSRRHTSPRCTTCPRCSSSRPAVATSPTCSSTVAWSCATAAAPSSTPTTSWPAPAPAARSPEPRRRPL